MKIYNDMFLFLFAIVLVYVLKSGNKKSILDFYGWKNIRKGILFIFFGVMIELTADFILSFQYIGISRFLYTFLLRDITGFLPGAIFFAIGLTKFMKAVTILKDNEMTLCENHGRLRKELSGLVLSLDRETKMRLEAEKDLYRIKKKIELDIYERTKELLNANFQLKKEISDRKRSERALKESEERYALTIKATSDGIWDWNLTNNQIYTSERFLEILGLRNAGNPQFFSIEHWGARIHPDDKEKVFYQLYKHIEGQGPFNVDYRYAFSRDEYRWHHATGLAFYNEEGSVYRVVGAVKDIHDRKQAEAALYHQEIARAAAEKSSRMKDEFLATVSHELRTPLTSIIGFAQTIRRAIRKGITVNDKMEKIINDIIESGALLDDLINDLIDIAIIDSDRLEMKLGPVKLEEVFVNVEQVLKYQANVKGLDLSWNCVESAPLVFSDPRRLKQIMLNLVGNAIKFTDTGFVKIDIVNADDAENFVIIAVSDSGPGIPEEYHEMIFNRFTRLESSGNLPGSGLGLAISKKLVEKMDGEIWIESESGKGTTFFFSLKRWKEQLSL